MKSLVFPKHLELDSNLYCAERACSYWQYSRPHGLRGIPSMPSGVWPRSPSRSIACVRLTSFVYISMCQMKKSVSMPSVQRQGAKQWA